MLTTVSQGESSCGGASLMRCPKGSWSLEKRFASVRLMTAARGARLVAGVEIAAAHQPFGSASCADRIRSAEARTNRFELLEAANHQPGVDQPTPIVVARGSESPARAGTSSSDQVAIPSPSTPPMPA
jgi:hypothetical protein